MNGEYMSLAKLLEYQKTNFPGYRIVEKKEARGRQPYDRYKIVDIVKNVSVKENEFKSIEFNGILFIEMKHD